MNILFFGSTNDSLLVLDALATFTSQKKDIRIAAVVTQPPRPVGRKSDPVPTPVELWGKKHAIPVLTFDTNPEKPWLYRDEKSVVNTLSTEKPDILITACYGQKIPAELIALCPHGGLNVHPSLLPRWRGADPIPWTILSGDAQTGVSIVTISEQFDQGKIIEQKKIPVDEKQSVEEIRSTLFQLGADLLVSTLPAYLNGSRKGKDQDTDKATVAKKLNRAHGYIPWEVLQAAIEGRSEDVTDAENFILNNAIGTLPEKIWRSIRALSPWPGVWTTVRLPEEKRLKILKANTNGEKLILDTVQLEGKNPVAWNTFIKSYDLK